MSSNSLMQVEDRFRKTNHSSPETQAKQTGRGLEPPVPSRSESFSNGNSESVHPALQRPAEPQVAAAAFAVLRMCGDSLGHTQSIVTLEREENGVVVSLMKDMHSAVGKRELRLFKKIFVQLVRNTSSQLFHFPPP